MLLVNFRYAVLLALVVIFLLTGCGDQTAKPSESLNSATNDTPIEHALKHLNPKYVCPMHPQIVRDEEGSCPICGMDLVKKHLDTGDSDAAPVVTLNSAVVQNMGLRTVKVRRSTLWKYIQTPGRIAFDETNMAHIHPRAAGWVEKLHFQAEGESIKKGQTVLEIYAPDMLAAQVDFLIALDSSRIAREKARNRLRLLDVPENVIEKIQNKKETRNNIPIVAPQSGIISQLMIREGMYVKPENEIMTIADLSKVWVQVDVFEHQIAWVEPGLGAEMRIAAYPGKIWQGTVEYIYPDLDELTRTLRVRLSFDNPDLLLKPNMLSEVVIFGGPKHDLVNVPRDALIETGTREAVVKALGDGRFQPIDVVTGMKQGGYVEIVSGLKEGDDIVISGQFLIDSESNLQASFRRMSEK